MVQGASFYDIHPLGKIILLDEDLLKKIMDTSREWDAFFLLFFLLSFLPMWANWYESKKMKRTRWYMKWDNKRRDHDEDDDEEWEIKKVMCNL